MQLGETTQDVRRNVLVVAVFRRPVMRLADADVGGAIKQSLEPDAPPALAPDELPVLSRRAAAVFVASRAA